MKILIVYDTYSGGTQAAAEFLSKILTEKSHQITIKRAGEAQSSDFAAFDTIILATPSWLERKKEGQPHINFLKLIDSAQNIDFKNKKFAFMGLGDESYAHFCNGIDTLVTFVKEKGGETLGEPLKLDSYYMDISNNESKILNWAQNLPLN